MIVVFSNEKRLDEWNRKESSETDPHKYSQLTFEKGKDNPMEQRESLQQCYNNWTSTCKE